MRTVDRYIFRQFCIAGTGFLLVLTCAAFLTQTIRIVDMVAFHGKGAVLFAELCLFLGPSILVVSLPMAGFVGTVFVIYRMHGDSEIPALYAAGSGTLRLAWPVCLFALLIAVLTALMALYLSPLGLSKSQERVFHLKNDIGALLLKDGQFLSPSKGVTAFIRQIDKQRVMHDIFVHDKSRREATTTYSAQQAVLEWVDARSQLTMFDGAAYAVGWDGNQVSLLRFDQFVYDLSELSPVQIAFSSSPGDGRDRVAGLRPACTRRGQPQNVYRRRSRTTGDTHLRLRTSLSRLGRASCGTGPGQSSDVSGGCGHRGGFRADPFVFCSQEPDICFAEMDTGDLRNPPVYLVARNFGAPHC